MNKRLVTVAGKKTALYQAETLEQVPPLGGQGESEREREGQRGV